MLQILPLLFSLTMGLQPLDTPAITYTLGRIIMCEALTQQDRDKAIGLYRTIKVYNVANNEAWCGESLKETKEIWMNIRIGHGSDFKNSCQYRKTLTHEILHLLDYDHVTKEEKKVFKKLLWKCK